MDSSSPEVVSSSSKTKKRKQEWENSQVKHNSKRKSFNFVPGKRSGQDFSRSQFSHNSRSASYSKKFGQRSFTSDSNSDKRVPKVFNRYFSPGTERSSKFLNEPQLKVYGLTENRSAHYDGDSVPDRRIKGGEDITYSDGRDKAGRKPEVHSEEKNLYFKNVMETIKQGIDEDAREVFIANVLEQTEGQELQLSSQHASSYCIQFLLDSCDDLSVIVRFMKAFESDKPQCCGNRYACHITENLLYYGIKNLQNWSSDMQPNQDDEESLVRASHVSDIMSWIQNLSTFCLENLKTCLDDFYACYVLRSLIQVLGGCYLAEKSVMSKKLKSQKSGLQHRYLGDEYVCKPKTDIILNEIPKFFVTDLKKIAKAFKQLDDIKTYAFEARTVPVLCSLLLSLKKRLPKRFAKTSNFLSNILFEDTDNDGVPQVLLHKSCSYIVEKLFETLSDKQQDLWDKYISCHAEKLIEHQVGNYVLQRLFDVVENNNQFEIMYQSVSPFFREVLLSHHYGIFVALSSACVRLKCQQAQMTKDLMQCLGCEETEDKQECFVRLLLGFQHYGDYIQKQSSQESNLQVILLGSLVVQQLLKFHKPVKVVRSILSMKPEELSYLACHTQGCHVLTAFLLGENVGEKNKAKLLNTIKPVIASLVCDHNGSLTLCRMWTLLTIKQKGIIAQELASHENELRNDSCARKVLSKFGIRLFKSRHEEWKKFLENVKKIDR